MGDGSEQPVLRGLTGPPRDAVPITNHLMRPDTGRGNTLSAARTLTALICVTWAGACAHPGSGGASPTTDSHEYKCEPCPAHAATQDGLLLELSHGVGSTIHQAGDAVDRTYIARVYANGTVQYQGLRYVAVTGFCETRLGADRLALLQSALADLQFTSYSDLPAIVDAGVGTVATYTSGHLMGFHGTIEADGKLRKQMRAIEHLLGLDPLLEPRPLSQQPKRPACNEPEGWGSLEDVPLSLRPK